MNKQSHSKKAKAAIGQSTDKPATAGKSKAVKTTSGNKTILPDGLKPKLQNKSSTRRKRLSASVKVESAANRHGRNDLQPTLETVEKRIDDLNPSPNRVRITTPEQLEKVITSIKQYGMVIPPLIDGAGTIISGHIVWEAAVKLGFETIACLPIEHLDESEVEALALALNRVGETGTWNIELLGERMLAIESEGIELVSTGFTLQEIDQITLSGALDEEEQEQEETEGEHQSREPVVDHSDLFQLGPHRLLCGDALDPASYETLLEEHKANCVVSDSPFNCRISGFVSGLGKHKHQDFIEGVGEKSDAEFTEFLATWLCKASTSAGAIIFAFMDWRQIEKLLMAGEEAGLTRKNIAVWNKGGGGGMGSLYRSAHELIAVFCNGNAPKTNNIELGRHGRNRSNVWSYPGANRPGTSSAKALADHPTPKNLAMIEDMLLDVTERGDIVLDPFLGSGTTMIAAENTQRVCAGIELDPIYVERAIRRWERYTGEAAIHLETGMTLDELGDLRSGEGEK
jgi:DNA modification methylase